MTPTLIKSFRATAAVEGYRIVAATEDDAVTTATSAAALAIGFSNSLGCDAGQALDVIQAGWAEVKLGGAVAFGEPVTAGAAGVGVPAVPTAGVTVRYAGLAMSNGEAGDIIPVLVAPGLIHTPA